VFLDEHPDSINDGYFLPSSANHLFGTGHTWEDIPASYHAGAAGFAFADGHSEIHKWKGEGVQKPITTTPYGGGLPITTPEDQADYQWVINGSSVGR
jgi:prepilin-type processing-associated H-X9-DG protein